MREGRIQLIQYLVAASGVAAFIVCGSPVVGATTSIYISEVMWVGSTNSSSDEWIELFNPTDEAVSLAGWTLRNAGTAAAPHLVLPDNLTIAPDSYVVIANFSADDERSAFGVATEATAQLSLLNSNNGDLVLVDDEGVEVDRVIGEVWPAGGIKANQRLSMERRWPIDVSGVLSPWYDSTETVDEVHFGTPGRVNSVPVINHEPVAVLSGPATGVVHDLLTFSAEDSTDLEGDNLSYSWQMGDGVVKTGAVVQHRYEVAGTYLVTLLVSDDEFESEEQQSVVIRQPVYSSAIVINEFLPNPTGSDDGEFIELYNTSGERVDLSGWRLDDGESGSAPYLIPEESIIEGRSYQVFYRTETKLALNNTSDSVRLFDPGGAVRSLAAYTTSSEGWSYNRENDGAWVLSTAVTPAAANSIVVPSSDELLDEEEELEEEVVKGVGKIAGTTSATVALTDIRKVELGTTVTTEGIISVPPKLLGTQVLYLAGSGIQVYLHGGDFPDLALGDRVRVTGVLGSNRGELRLKLDDKTAVVRLSPGESPKPHVIATGDVDEAWEGSLVTVQGEVTQTSGSTFYIDDGSGEVKIHIRSSTGIQKPKMKQGMAVTITGVVSEVAEVYRILPRFQEDVRLGRVAGLTSFPATGLRSVLSRGLGYVQQIDLGHQSLLRRGSTSGFDWQVDSQYDWLVDLLYWRDEIFVLLWVVIARVVWLAVREREPLLLLR